MVSLEWVRGLSPLWPEGTPFRDHQGQGLGLEPVYPWDRPRPIPSETMISIKKLHLTAAASRESGFKVSRAAAAGELGRSAPEGGDIMGPRSMLPLFLAIGLAGCSPH